MFVYVCVLLLGVNVFVCLVCALLCDDVCDVHGLSLCLPVFVCALNWMCVLVVI